MFKYDLLSTSIKVKDKKQVLKQEFDIDTSVELEERMRNMCNLADGIEARGVAKGRAEGRTETLVTLVIDGLLDKEVAADRAGLSIERFDELIASMQG